MSVTTVPARVCNACGCWPCRCEPRARTAPIVRAVRPEPCACGTLIVAHDATDALLADAVAVHVNSKPHRRWRAFALGRGELVDLRGTGG